MSFRISPDSPFSNLYSPCDYPKTPGSFTGEILLSPENEEDISTFIPSDEFPSTPGSFIAEIPLSPHGEKDFSTSIPSDGFPSTPGSFIDEIPLSPQDEQDFSTSIPSDGFPSTPGSFIAEIPLSPQGEQDFSTSIPSDEFPKTPGSFIDEIPLSPQDEQDFSTSIPSDGFPSTPGAFIDTFPLKIETVRESRLTSSKSKEVPKPLYNLRAGLICPEPQYKSLHKLISNLPLTPICSISSTDRAAYRRSERKANKLPTFLGDDRDYSLKSARKKVWQESQQVKILLSLCEQNPFNYDSISTTNLDELGIATTVYWARIAKTLSNKTGKSYSGEQCSKKYFSIVLKK